MWHIHDVLPKPVTSRLSEESARYAEMARLLTDFTRWMNEGQTLAIAFHANGMALPEPLMRFAGDVMGAAEAPESESESESEQAQIIIPPPKAPPSPKEAAEGWIYIDAKVVGPRPLVLAVLRAAAEPMRAREVVDAMRDCGTNASPGTVVNLGAVLEAERIIERTEAGWTLIDVSRAPVLHEGFVWGPPDAFNVYDLAHHRREAVMHVLRLHDEGLQMMQLVRKLELCVKWLHAPVSKHLAKQDIEALVTEGRIRRVGNTNKWVAKGKEAPTG